MKNKSIRALANAKASVDGRGAFIDRQRVGKTSTKRPAGVSQTQSTRDARKNDYEIDIYSGADQALGMSGYLGKESLMNLKNHDSDAFSKFRKGIPKNARPKSYTYGWGGPSSDEKTMIEYPSTVNWTTPDTRRGRR